MTRYFVDGLLYDDPESDYASDGQFPPFVVFDQQRQDNVAGAYPTRKAAKLVADQLNAGTILRPMSLDEALEWFSVRDADDVAPPANLTGWFAVVDEDGINAYFSTETAALRHRLDLINRRLNP